MLEKNEFLKVHLECHLLYFKFVFTKNHTLYQQQHAVTEQELKGLDKERQSMLVESIILYLQKKVRQEAALHA